MNYNNNNSNNNNNNEKEKDKKEDKNLPKRTPIPHNLIFTSGIRNIPFWKER